MATLDHEDADVALPKRPAITLPRLRLLQILAISIFYFALSFHWAALQIIMIPGQVLRIVGDAQKGTALAFVLIPGAFVSLFANPLFGWLSDRTHGRLAAWGRRRPFIVGGVLVNIAALVWMALARDILSLAIAYSLVQFSSNAAQAPFHALLPDLVPQEQRGLTSGIMGVLNTVGTIGGVILSGMIIDSSKPLPQYQQELWTMYAIICAILMGLMLITVLTVRESQGLAARIAEQEREQTPAPEPEATEPKREKRTWLTSSIVVNVAGTLLVAACVWGLMWLWNTLHFAGIELNSNVQQVVLEVIITVGLLRMFDFNPRRDPDFAWVLVTRLVMMLGIYTIQNFLLFYMRDVVRAPHPESTTSTFTILVSITGLASGFAGGWLSDHFGRKRMVYIAGSFMALVGLVFIITHSLPLVLAAGAIFGLGYGAYTSVDWALVADVLPSHKTYARDMGIWNIALSLPQVLAPAIGAPIVDNFTAMHQPTLGFQLLFTVAIIYCIAGTVTVRFIKGVKK